MYDVRLQYSACQKAIYSRCSSIFNDWSGVKYLPFCVRISPATGFTGIFFINAISNVMIFFYVFKRPKGQWMDYWCRLGSSFLFPLGEMVIVVTEA